MTKSAFEQILAKTAAARRSKERLARLQKCADFLGAPVGGLRANWMAAKDWWDGRAPGASNGTQVDAKQIIRNNNIAHDSVAVLPTTAVDNLHGRFNQWRSDRFFRWNPNATPAQVSANARLNPQPYGIAINDEYRGFGATTNPAYGEMLRQRQAVRAPATTKPGVTYTAQMPKKLRQIGRDFLQTGKIMLANPVDTIRRGLTGQPIK